MVSTATGEPSKSERIQQLLAIVEDLSQETLLSNTEEYHRNYQGFRRKVREVVMNTLAPIQDADLLGSLAVLAWTMAFPGKAGDGKFDEIFFQTYDICIEKLAETPSLKNYQVLKTIDCHLCLDGGDSLLFQKMMVRKFGKYSGITDLPVMKREPAQREQIQEFKGQSTRYTLTELQEFIERANLKEVDANAPLPEVSELSDKRERIRELFTITRTLYQHAVNPQLKEQRDTTIAEMLAHTLTGVHDPGQLGRLAGMAWMLYAFGDTRDAQIDAVFYHTYRICIEKLADNPCRETYSELELLHQCRLCLEGEEQQFFEEKLNSVIQHLKETGQWP